MGAPQIRFFTYYIRAPSELFLLTLFGAPQISFLAYYIGFYFIAPSQVSLFATICPPPSGQFLHKLCGGRLTSISLFTLWSPLRSVYLLLYRGPPQVSFFNSMSLVRTKRSPKTYTLCAVG